MKTRNLLIAAVVLLALSGLLYWSKKHPPSASSEGPADAPPKIADIAETSVQELQLAHKDGVVITVDRGGDGKWRVTSPQDVPADQDAVAAALGALNPLMGDSVVEDKASNLAQYGLQPPALTVAVKQKNGKTSTFLFGNDLPVGSEAYLDANGKVYTVSTSTKTSLDKSESDLRDKRLLSFDINKLTTVELGPILFAKNNSGDWQIVKPQPYRADNFQVEELVRKLSDAKMDPSEDEQKAAQAFASGSPVPVAKLTGASGTQTLEVRKNKDDYYARSSVVPGIHKVPSDLGTELAKKVDDFRNKKLFDFGFNDPTRIDTPQGSYVRSGTDWKLNGKVMDPGQVQSLVDKLRDLTATKLSSGELGPQVLSITVVSNDGKRTEKVDFAKAAAKRSDDPTLYELDQSTVDDLIKATSQIKPAKK